ncbi:penicillin-binding protein 1A [Thermodesulforhabdus norvegica]|uniref:peptidoglycan glycosyltransferase n=1 Tax=Thermodesulforhabdus norvegica TaxID=39841 RepID=A0A1I4SSZ9_9BACT|nr:PBP1A family penicillin-binding protein [Thermodesulforhabdus norvegica]SFM67541.1 penicillin-binding protein 1A [Thermodesulforhabdus norvegica]
MNPICPVSGRKKPEGFVLPLLLWMLVTGCILVCALIAVFLAHIEKNLPSIDSLKNYRPPVVTTVYARDGSVIGEFNLERRYLVPFEQVPGHVKQAFLAAEDARFYEHPGVDIWSVVRAAVVNLKAGAIVQGGSTITQQVVKALLLSPERTWERKIREAILAYKIDKFLTKDQIFYIYLNQVYFGAGAYGVEAAARTYFDKHVRDLTVAEAALLAGLPKAPSKFNPFENMDAAKRRQHYVLKRMVEEGFISSEEAEKAIREPLNLSSKKHHYLPNYFTEEVRKYLLEKFGEKITYQGGLGIYTTMDPVAQKIAEAVLVEGLKTYDRRHGFRGPVATGLSEREYLENYASGTEEAGSDALLFARVRGADAKTETFFLQVGRKTKAWLPKPGWKWTGKSFSAMKKILTEGSVVEVKPLKKLAEDEWIVSLEQTPEVEGAIICADPRTGEVLCMVGGKDFRSSQFNRVTQMKRQPGSAFKPIVYAAAIDKGFTEASIVMDTPLVKPGSGPDDLWKPGNFDGKFLGPMILRDAVALSRNVVAVKVLNAVGVKTVIELARKLGISSELTPTLSLALGASGLSPWELAQAYAVFANGGEKRDFYLIERIVDSEGNTLFEHTPRSERILSPETAYIVTDLLRAVVQKGTGRYASRLGRPAAGKTGTTNEFRDAWFVGYTPDMLAAVWVGFDDFRRSLGRNETGGRVACPVWTHFMQKWYEATGSPPRDFPIPSDIVFAKVDLERGTRATPESTRIEFLPFKKDHLPPSADSLFLSSEPETPASEQSIYKTGLF